MGSPVKYWDDFNDEFDRRPGNWDALATISAVVLDRARTKGGLQNGTSSVVFCSVCVCVCVRVLSRVAYMCPQ